MSVTVEVYATLRNFVEHETRLSGNGHTVKEVLSDLAGRYPELSKALYTEDGSARRFYQLYVNEEPAAYDTAVSDGDRLLLLPAIAGGSRLPEALIAKERSKAESLDEKEIDRYGNHLLLKDIGVKGQKRLKAAKVLVVGLGALGTPVVQYLAAAGIGTLGIWDSASVTAGDTQSQVMHGTRDVKRPKVMSARDTIRAINPLVKIETYTEEPDAGNLPEVIAGFDLVVDCSGNFKTRYLISDACTLARIPDVFAAIFQYEGRIGVYGTEGGPCLRCQFPETPPGDLIPSCASGGVIGPLPGVIGSFQAVEAIKLLIGGGETLVGENLIIDVWNNRSVKVSVPKSDTCPLCGKNPTIFTVQDFDYEDFCGLKEDENEIPVEGIEPEELARRLDAGEELKIIDVREPHERAIIRFPNAVWIPVGQLVRRQHELDPNIDTIFICREGKRSILAINTLREAGYKGPMYNLKGGMEAGKDLILASESGWL